MVELNKGRIVELNKEVLAEVITKVFADEGQDVMDSGIRPSGKELDAWDFVAKHFMQFAAFVTPKIIREYERRMKTDA